MSKRSPANVLAAYDLLLEELASEIDWVNQTGAEAFAAGDHARAARALERAQKLQTLHRSVQALGQQLRDIVQGGGSVPAVRTRLGKGLKTPEEAYRLPILRALVELGGSGDVNAVLDRVYAALRGRLNEHDLAPMPSNPSCPRWRNTAQWARNDLRKEGLISGDSPHGLWEISPAGRAWLAAHGDEG